MKRRTLQKYLIISFIIHLLLFLWFLFHDFYTNRTLTTTLSQEQKMNNAEQEILVMLSPSTSPDGDSDIPTVEKPTSDSTTSHNHTTTPEEQSRPTDQQAEEKEQQQTPPEPEKPTPAQELIRPEELPMQADQMKKGGQQQTLPDPEKREPLQKDDMIEKRDTKKQPPHRPHKPEEKKDIQPRMSILSMTAQLLKASHAQQGNSLAKRDGEDRMPSLKELKYLSYQNRIDEMIMNSWRIVSRSFRSSHETVSSDNKASISFEINKDGSLAFVTLTSSSGNRSFDKAVIEAVKQAAPFPPIPEHLGLERFRPVGGNYHVRW